MKRATGAARRPPKGKVGHGPVGSASFVSAARGVTLTVTLTRTRERIWQPPKGAQDDGPAIRRRAEWFLRSLGVTDTRRLAMHMETYRARRPRMRALPRVAETARPLKGAFDVVGPEGLRAVEGKRPAEKESWGATGRYVRVDARGVFRSAELRIRLDEKQLDHLLSESVHMARWAERLKRFVVVPRSGFVASGGYLTGRISRPGVYTAIGLPRDPRLLTTLQVLKLMRPWITLDPKGGRRVVDPICQLILCAGFMREALADQRLLERHGLSPADFPGGYGGGDVCKECLGLDIDIPEIEIPELVEPPLKDRPQVVWPTPCDRWENLGPRNVTGRIGSLVVHPSRGATIYAGSTGGGVWRSTDGGDRWAALMSQELSLAIGGLAIAPSDPSVLYAATGEWTSGIGWPADPIGRGGVGVYRTANHGADWDLCAPIPSTMCAAVAVDPTDADRVYVAGEVGLHRSRDGGRNWDISVGLTRGVFDGEISDVVIDPNNVLTLFIGVHNDGVHRSTDGGNTWTRLSNGIDTGAIADAPKIALGRNGASGSNFVAVKMGDRVYTSTDGGTTFTRRTDTGNPIWFTAWANVMAVDPDDEDVLFAGASRLYRSTDGGVSWTQVGGVGTNIHADMQAVVFDPNDHDHVYVATDGGIWASTDNGVTWTFASTGLVATHFYVMSASQTPAVRYAGSLQDDDGYAYKGLPDWEPLNLGEGGYVEYDPDDENVIYHDGWWSVLNKSTDGGATWTVLPIDTDDHYAEPLAISRQDSNLLLALDQTGPVTRSTDGGTTWNSVLTPGVVFSAVRFAPSDDADAYAGSNFGRIWHSADEGATWTELNTTALPNALVRTIAVDRSDPRRIYVAFGGTGIRHLWRGDLDAAGNVTWSDVSGVLPAVSLPDLPLTGLALHPSLEETIYVSTLLGVLRSTDGGDSWAPFDEGLPNTLVSDLDVRIRDRSLFASTLGRGMYRRLI